MHLVLKALDDRGLLQYRLKHRVHRVRAQCGAEREHSETAHGFRDSAIMTRDADL